MYLDKDGTWRYVDRNTSDGEAKREFLALVKAHES